MENGEWRMEQLTVNNFYLGIASASPPALPEVMPRKGL
jgi:hypothetical protein